MPRTPRGTRRCTLSPRFICRCLLKGARWARGGNAVRRNCWFSERVGFLARASTVSVRLLLAEV